MTDQERYNLLITNDINKLARIQNLLVEAEELDLTDSIKSLQCDLDNQYAYIWAILMKISGYENKDKLIKFIYEVFGHIYELTEKDYYIISKLHILQ